MDTSIESTLLALTTLSVISISRGDVNSMSDSIISKRIYSTKEYCSQLPALSSTRADAIPHSPGGDP